LDALCETPYQIRALDPSSSAAIWKLGSLRGGEKEKKGKGDRLEIRFSFSPLLLFSSSKEPWRAD
jgi:hypothetical protein